MATPNATDTLGQLAMFKSLSPTELQAIAAICERQIRKTNETLCAEGDPGDSMYVLTIGYVDVYKKTAQGDEQKLATIQAPSVIGELALIDGAARSATVRAGRPVEVFRISNEHFNALRAEFHPAAYKIIRHLSLVLCDRLRETNDKISEFFADPEKSLAAMKKRQQELWQKRQQGASNGGGS